MKQFIELRFNLGDCQRELNEFRQLLDSKSDLSEQNDIRPFFAARPQLSALMGTYAPEVGLADLLAYEFPIIGDFAADVVVGNKRRGAFCLIELEEASTNSIFTSNRNKATREWSRRFEHGFSQLVDWFYALDDLKTTKRFAKDFGYKHARFIGILVVGRSAALSEDDRSRLNWRSERVLVNSHYVHCLTFDDLYEHLAWRLSHYTAVESDD